MARIRTIKPEIATHEGLYDLEIETNLPIRFAWCMLFTICDREGRFAWRPRALKAHVLPYDLVEFSRVLDAWLTRGFVVKYRIGNDWYGWVPTFTRHQVINNREVASSIPPVEKADEVTDLRNQQVAHASSTREAREDDASSTREARVRHAASGEGKGKEGKGKEDIEQTSSVLTLADASGSVDKSPFEKFWAVYPKKAKRKEAQKVWASRHLDSKADALVTDVKRRVADDRRWLDGFIPDPTTYLRGERWNDAIEPVKPNGKHANSAEAEAKARGQIADLARDLGMTQGEDDWPAFKLRVERANARRLEHLGRRRQA